MGVLIVVSNILHVPKDYMLLFFSSLHMQYSHSAYTPEKNPYRNVQNGSTATESLF